MDEKQLLSKILSESEAEKYVNDTDRFVRDLQYDAAQTHGPDFYIEFDILARNYKYARLDYYKSMVNNRPAKEKDAERENMMRAQSALIDFSHRK